VVVVSYSGKEINAKLVYYGAGLSGKTTNLESIYEAVPDTSRGKMVSMKTQSDRTLFFDLLPLDLGEIMGFKTRFLLYTVPGQVFYNATRKLVLKGADAIVFVADSEVGKMEENKESLANLRANLAEYSLSLDEIPWVIQYNKRDLPNVYSVQELNDELNPGGRVPFFEAVATTGKGVFETFRGVSHHLMEKVTRDLRRTPTASSPVASNGARVAAPVEQAPPSPPSPPAPVEAPAVTRAETVRAAAAPPAPSQAIAREAQVTTARPTDTGLDYGREIELPSTPAPAPVASAPRFQTSNTPSMATVPPRRAPVSAPVAAQPAPAVRVEDAPSPYAVGEIESRPGPGARELVVPITLPKGTSHEIVLKIVLKVEG
jgi:signal recognition particle receptor subunit beta